MEALHDNVCCLTQDLFDEITLIRNEYVDVWRHVKKARRSPHEMFTGLAVLGQPGIGECS